MSSVKACRCQQIVMLVVANQMFSRKPDVVIESRAFAPEGYSRCRRKGGRYPAMRNHLQKVWRCQRANVLNIQRARFNIARLKATKAGSNDCSPCLFPVGLVGSSMRKRRGRRDDDVVGVVCHSLVCISIIRLRTGTLDFREDLPSIYASGAELLVSSNISSYVFPTAYNRQFSSAFKIPTRLFLIISPLAKSDSPISQRL